MLNSKIEENNASQKKKLDQFLVFNKGFRFLKIQWTNSNSNMDQSENA